MHLQANREDIDIQNKCTSTTPPRKTVTKDDFIKCLELSSDTVDDHLDKDTESTPSKASSTPNSANEEVVQTKNITGAPLVRYAFIQALTTQVSDLKSTEVHRIALQARFYDLWSCKDGSDYNCTTPMWSIASRSRTLSLCLDALTLIHCGSSSGNEQLLGEARSMYSLAIGSLRTELDNSSDLFNSLLAVHILQLCELFDFLAVGSDSWRRHVSGMNAIMEKCNTSSGIEQSGWVLSKIIRVPFGLWSGLVRDGGSTPIKKFTANAIKAMKKNVKEDSLLYYGRVPAVLARGEGVIAQGRKASALTVLNVLEDIIATEGALHRNLAKAHDSRAGTVYHLTSLEKLRTSTIASHIADTTTFTQGFVFSSLLVALEHAYYWMSLLALRRMHMAIREAVSKSAYPFEYDFCGFSQEALTKTAYEVADNLCKTVLYMTLPRNGYIGMICAIAPIQLASQGYKEQQDWAKLKWCREAASALQARGLAKFEMG